MLACHVATQGLGFRSVGGVLSSWGEVDLLVPCSYVTIWGEKRNEKIKARAVKRVVQIVVQWGDTASMP